MWPRFIVVDTPSFDHLLHVVKRQQSMNAQEFHLRTCPKSGIHFSHLRRMQKLPALIASFFGTDDALCHRVVATILGPLIVQDLSPASPMAHDHSTASGAIRIGPTVSAVSSKSLICLTQTTEPLQVILLTCPNQSSLRCYNSPYSSVATHSRLSRVRCILPLP